MTLRPLPLLGGALLFTLACGGSGGGTGTSSGSTSEGTSSTSSTASTSSTSASASTSGSATSTESGTTGEPTTGSTGGPGGDPTGGPSGDPTGSSTTAVEMTTGSTSSGSTGGSSSGGSTGMMGACAMLGPNQCMANASCMAITGSKINLEKMCLQKPVFLQCADAMGCGDALTIACPTGTTEPWQFPSTCIPDDYEPCDGMVLDMACK